MSNKNTTFTSSVRARHAIRPLDIFKVLSHRRRGGQEQFLVLWRAKSDASPSAICSWHDLDELTRALQHVQKYLETRPRSNPTQKNSLAPPSLLQNRKRKSPDSNPIGARDRSLGILSPEPSSERSRATSVISVGSSSESHDGDPDIYNGVLEKKEGRIVAKKLKHSSVVKINATTLPTAQMLAAAAVTPVTQAEKAIRKAFYRKLRGVPNLSLENIVDSSIPSLDFTFVKDYVLGEGVYRADPETFEGCQKPCRPNMGQYIGCEYPRDCSCLEYAAVNERALEEKEPKRFREYMRQKAEGEFIDKTDLPKRFPYQKPRGENMPQTLQPFYREQRHPIYECNVNCKCGPVCKSRVVQKGRKVPLTIFKTHNRGWGVCCREDLIQGEFIDTYLGEVITNEEAGRREDQVGTTEKASYLYSLDKFIGDDPQLTAENCYVVDGQYMGGPTRFINHSCEPNCRQYTVSYNKHDPRVYDLAFFAIEDIPTGTELNFDYMDKDEEEEEDAIRRREQAASDPENVEKVPCNCGARKCRGYLWV